MQKIKLTDIGYDPKYYPRVNGREDWVTVLRYKEALEVRPELADPKKCKEAFPPIVVVAVKGKAYRYLVLDGLHRIKAFAQADFDCIWATVERLPQSKWLARSVELNLPQLRGLDSGDKAWVCQRLEAEGWSVKQVAVLLQMRVESLEKIKVTRCQKLRVSDAKKIPVGRGNRKVNGKSYGFVKSPFQELTGTNRGVEALKRQGSCAAPNILSILDSFLAALESGAIDMTNDEVAARMKRIEERMEEMKAAL